MPRYLVSWVKSFTSNRTYRLCFDNNSLATFAFPRALPQGSPASPVLFAIMMSAILEIESPAASTVAYADDMNESAAAVTITAATHQLGRSACQ
jgi:hypothetical protein